MSNDCGELVRSTDSFTHLEVSYVNWYIRANQKSYLLRRKSNWVGALVSVWLQIKKLVYFTIQFIFAIIYGPLSTFWYYL